MISWDVEYILFDTPLGDGKAILLKHREGISLRAEDRGKYAGITLGGYRRGKYFPTFEGSTFDVWRPCARQEVATGVPWPHAFFLATIGRRGVAEDGSMYCHGCRGNVPLGVQTSAPKKTKPTNQMSLF